MFPVWLFKYTETSIRGKNTPERAIYLPSMQPSVLSQPSIVSAVIRLYSKRKINLEKEDVVSVGLCKTGKTGISACFPQILYRGEKYPDNKRSDNFILKSIF